MVQASWINDMAIVLSAIKATKYSNIATSCPRFSVALFVPTNRYTTDLKVGLVMTQTI
jgi:hypothetical protein